MKFKNLLSILALSVIALAGPLAKAQTTNISASNVFTTTEQWFTTDTGNRWNQAHGYVQTGAVYQNQVNIAAATEAGVRLKSLGTNSDTFIGATAEELNAGIAGTALQIDAEITYGRDINDVQLQAGVGPGYNLYKHQPFADVVFEVQKKTGKNTHLYARADETLGDKTHGVPRVTAGFGGSF